MPLPQQGQLDHHPDHQMKEAEEEILQYPDHFRQGPYSEADTYFMSNYEKQRIQTSLEIFDTKINLASCMNRREIPLRITDSRPSSSFTAFKIDGDSNRAKVT